MKHIMIIALLLYALPVLADDPVPAITPPTIAEATPDATTETVTVPKAEYDRLVQENEALRGEINRITHRRTQLLQEIERQAAELGLWRSRLERVLQCATIHEAIEELQAVLVGQVAREAPPSQR